MADAADRMQEPSGSAAPDDGGAEGGKPDAVDEHMGPGAVKEGVVGQAVQGRASSFPSTYCASPMSGVTVSSGAPPSVLITSLTCTPPKATAQRAGMMTSR